MKVGVRKPSIKKSFKARTTGKLKRSVKKAVVPGYGKKGMGLVKDPKKAIYNKVYNKTTIGVGSLSGSTKTKRANSNTNNSQEQTQHNLPRAKKVSNGTSWFIWGGIFGFFALMSRNPGSFIIFGIVCFILIYTGLNKRKAYDSYLNADTISANQEMADADALLIDAKTEFTTEEAEK